MIAKNYFDISHNKMQSIRRKKLSQQYRCILIEVLTMFCCRHLQVTRSVERDNGNRPCRAETWESTDWPQRRCIYTANLVDKTRLAPIKSITYAVSPPNLLFIYNIALVSGLDYIRLVHWWKSRFQRVLASDSRMKTRCFVLVDWVLKVMCQTSIMKTVRTPTVKESIIFTRDSSARSAKRVLVIVILSVRPSVTTRYRFKPRWDRDKGFYRLIA